MIKKNEGITLIALVITIIVLLILAGVAIAMLSGENGILKKAAEAKTKTEEGQKTEETRLNDMELTTYFVTNNSKYKCGNGYITGLTIGKNSKDLKDTLKTLGYGLYDIEAKNAVNEDDNLSTGLAVMKDGKVIARTILFGDVNGDGTLEVSDANAISGAFNSFETAKNLKDYEKVAMDTNHDGSIDTNDMLLIQKYIQGDNIINQNVYANNANEISIECTDKLEENVRNTVIEKMKGSNYQLKYDENEQCYVIDGVENGTTTVKNILDAINMENIAIFKDETAENSKEENEKLETENVLKYTHKDGRKIILAYIIF